LSLENKDEGLFELEEMKEIRRREQKEFGVVIVERQTKEEEEEEDDLKGSRGQTLLFVISVLFCLVSFSFLSFALARVSVTSPLALRHQKTSRTNKGQRKHTKEQKR
jgi:hypothetical protein